MPGASASATHLGDFTGDLLIDRVRFSESAQRDLAGTGVTARPLPPVESPAAAVPRPNQPTPAPAQASATAATAEGTNAMSDKAHDTHGPNWTVIAICLAVIVVAITLFGPGTPRTAVFGVGVGTAGNGFRGLTTDGHVGSATGRTCNAANKQPYRCPSSSTGWCVCN